MRKILYKTNFIASFVHYLLFLLAATNWAAFFLAPSASFFLAATAVSFNILLISFILLFFIRYGICCVVILYFYAVQYHYSTRWSISQVSKATLTIQGQRHC